MMITIIYHFNRVVPLVNRLSRELIDVGNVIFIANFADTRVHAVMIINIVKILYFK